MGKIINSAFWMLLSLVMTVVAVIRISTDLSFWVYAVTVVAIAVGSVAFVIFTARLTMYISDYCDKKKRFAIISDLIPKRWTVVEDVCLSLVFDISKLKPRSFLKGVGTSISGEEMRKRAVEFKGNLGLADGKRLLAEQDKIPAEFKDYCILLPGAILRDSGGNLRVPYLYFDGSRWLLNFLWLGDNWIGFGRFACCE